MLKLRGWSASSTVVLVGVAEVKTSRLIPDPVSNDTPICGLVQKNSAHVS
ncbi:unnamed protein product [Amoebophrya sp. A25]|nr:unnamed protein product [Amoebophrya sp. A25]|eukprot:GSA25T00020843001.1